MADRYWVGGTGTWNTLSTTNWSATSGGSGGASVPTAADSVFFDQATTYTVTMTGALNCLDITVSAGTVTFATGTTPTLSVAGNWSTIANTVWNSTGTITFTSRTARTINSNNITIAAPVIFNGIDGSWTLQNNFITSSTSGTTLTNGTLSLDTYTLQTSAFSSSNSNNRTINFNTGKISIVASANATVWNTSTVTNFSYNGTPTVEFSGGGVSPVTKTINTGVMSEAQALDFRIIDTGGSPRYAFTTGNTVGNLTINGAQTINNIAITILKSFTHETTNGTTSFTGGANAWTFAATSGNHTINNISGFSYAFPWTFGSASSTATWTLANNLNISTSNLTLTNGTLDFNSKTLTAGGIVILTGTPSIANTGTGSFTTSVPITHTSGTFTLPFNVTTTSASGYTLTAGTLALGTNTLTTTIFSSSNSNTRTLNFGTGKIILTAGGTVTLWNTATVTNLSVSGTPLVESIAPGTSVTKTINTGALSEANAISFSLLTGGGSTGVTYAFTSGNTVKDLVINGSGQIISNISILIYGSFTHSTANGTTTFTAGTSAWTFAATSGNYNINNIAGFTYDFPWTFGSAASTATWTLANNLTLGATRQLTLTNGTLDFNSKTLSAAGITIQTGSPTIANTGTGSFTTTLPFTHTSGTFTLPFNVTTSSATGYTLTAGTLALGTNTLTTLVFSSSNSNSRTLNFGNGKIVLNGSVTATIWNTSTVTGMTVTGTSLVESIGGGSGVTKTITPGGLSEANAINFSLLNTSGTVTYTITAGAVSNLIVNGVQTLNNTALTIYDNFTHLTTNGTTTFTAGTNAWTFAATSGTHNLGFIQGFTYDFPWTFNGIGGTWVLPNNLTLGATRALTLTNGTVDFNSKTVSASGITVVTGSATATNLTTTLNLTHTSGTLTLGSATTVNNYTLTAGTINLNFDLTCATFSSNNTNTRTIVIPPQSALTIFVTGSNATIVDVSNATNFSFSGVFKFASTYTGSTGTRVFNYGSSGITSYALQVVGMGVSVNTTGATTGFVIQSTSTDTVTFTGSYDDFDLSGFAGTLSNTARSIYGNLVIPASVTLSSGTAVTTFASLTGQNAATKTITTNGKTIPFPVTVNSAASGYSFQLADNLTLNTAVATNILTLTAGTLDLSNQVVTAYALSSNNSNVRSINFGASGQIILTASAATVVDFTTASNFTYTGIPYIYTNYAGATGTRTINFGGTAGAITTNVFDITSNISGPGLVIDPTATDTISLTGGFGAVNLTGISATIGNAARTIYGNLTVPASGGALTAGTATTTLSSAALPRNDSYSTYFSGTSRATIPNSPTFNFGSDAFTIEAWIYLTGDLTGENLIVSLYGYTDNRRSWYFGTRLGVLEFRYDNDGTLATSVNGATPLSLRVWYHVAVVRSTGVKIYLNGVLDGSRATMASTLYNNTVDPVLIGAVGPNLAGHFPGYISNLRIVRGVEVYTGNFTVPTGPLGVTQPADTNISEITGTQTILLTCRKPTFVDDSTYGWSITPVSTSQSVTSPFVLIASTSVITTNERTLDFPVTVDPTAAGAVQLSGNLTLGSTRSLTLTQGSLLLNEKSLTAQTFISSNSNTRSIDFGLTGRIIVTGNAATLVNFTTATNFTYSGVPYIYSNYTGATGTRTFNFGGTAGASSSNAFDVTTSTAGTGLIIGSTATDTVALTGVFDNVDLTGLTSVLSNTARTVYGNLTIPATGGTLTAGAAATTLSSISLPNINGYSVYFNGLSYLQVEHDSSLEFGTGAFTAEAWIFINLVGSPQTIFNKAPDSTPQSGWLLQVSRAMTLITRVGAIPYASGISLSLFTWYHVALIRDNAGNVYLSVNGAVSQVGVSSANLSQVTPLRVGTAISSGAEFRGYISNARLVKGVALYTSNFTPSTSPLTASAETVFLGLQNITFVDNSTYAKTINVISGAVTSTSSPFPLSEISTSLITTNGRTLDFPIIVGDPANTTNVVKLAGNLTLGSTRALTFSYGTLNLNDSVLTASAFSSSNSNGRDLVFGTSGRLQLTGSSATILDISTITNFSYSGTPYIQSSYTGSVGTRTFNVGTSGALVSQVFDVATSGTTGIVIGVATDTVALTGTFNNVNLTGLTNTLSNTVRTIYGNLIVPATGGTLTAGTSATTIGAPTVPNVNGYSVYFNGTGTYLTAPAEAGNFAGAFTVEGWVYIPAATHALRLFVSTYLNSTTGWSIGTDANGYLSAWLTGDVADITGSTSMTLNAWHHFALSGQTGSINLFLNGIQQGATYTGGTTISSGGLLTLGVTSTAFQNLLTGYLSNIRILKGQALYTSNFTVPTAPLTAIENTSLLTCQNTTIVDNSTNNYTITKTGSPSVSSLSPFAVEPGTVQLTTNGRTLDFPITFGELTNGSGVVKLDGALTLGSTRSVTHTIGTLDLNDFTLTALTYVSNIGNNRSINFRSTGLIVLSGSAATVWDTSTGTGFSWSGNFQVNSTYAGSTGTRTFNFGNISETYAPNVKVSTGAGVFSLGTAADVKVVTGSINDFDLTSFAGNLNNSTRTIYGNLTIPSTGGNIIAGTSTTTFGSTSGVVKTVNTNARTTDFPYTFDGVGGNWQLTNNLVTSASRIVTLTNGTVDFNQKSVTAANIRVLTGNAALTNLSTTLNIVHTSGNLTINSGTINSATTGTYTLTAGNLILSGPLSTGAFTNNGGGILL